MCQNSETSQDLFKNQPPISDDEMKGFESGEGTLICTPTQFRIDFVRSWKKNALNKSARAIFIKDFLTAYGEGVYSSTHIPDGMVTEDSVGEVLDCHMIHRRSCYKELLQARTQEEINQCRKRKAMNARRSSVSTRNLVFNSSTHSYHSYTNTGVTCS